MPESYSTAVGVRCQPGIVAMAERNNHAGCVRHTALFRRECRRFLPQTGLTHSSRSPGKSKSPTFTVGLLFEGCLTMTYFRTGNLHYHRRAAVSRSCSRWEGVGPAGCCRQALSVGNQICVASDASSIHRKGRSKAWIRLRKHRNSRAMLTVMGSSRTGY